MEKKKIDIELQKQKVAKEMFKAQLEAKQLDLLAKEEGETNSTVGSLQNERECRISLQPH